MRLLCLPYAGANASLFRRWVLDASDDVDVWPIQLPGRGERLDEPPYPRLEPLIDDLCDLLAPLASDPYALFGCSMGAILAFELARAARRRGLAPPLHVFVAARQAPGRPDRHPPMHRLPDAEFVNRLREFAGTPPDILDDADAMSVFLPSLRADFALCERYAPQEEPPLVCPVTAFGGVADPYVSAGDLRQWREVTRGPFATRMFAGGHFFVQSGGADVFRAVHDRCLADLGVMERTR